MSTISIHTSCYKKSLICWSFSRRILPLVRNIRGSFYTRHVEYDDARTTFDGAHERGATRKVCVNLPVPIRPPVVIDVDQVVHDISSTDSEDENP